MTMNEVLRQVLQSDRRCKGLCTRLMLAIVWSVLSVLWQPAHAEGLHRALPSGVADKISLPRDYSAQISPRDTWLVVTESESCMPAVADAMRRAVWLAGKRYDVQPDACAHAIRGTRIVLSSLDGRLQRAISPPRNGYLGHVRLIAESASDGELVYVSKAGDTQSLHWYDATDERERVIELPPRGGLISGLVVTQDGRYVALTVYTRDRQQLWLVDLRNARTVRLQDLHINYAMGGCEWAQGRPPLICRSVPRVRLQHMVSHAAAPSWSPLVQQVLPTGSVATYSDLQSKRDDALLEDYLTSQIVSVQPDGQVTPLGRPGIYPRVETSPDGRYLLVEQIVPPYSGAVPLELFPRRIAVWTLSGQLVRVVSETSLQEYLPIGQDVVRAGVRDVRWRTDAPATLVLIEALDGGDPRNQSPAHPMSDRIRLLDAPFVAPVQLAETEMRFHGVQWVTADLVVVTEKSERSGYLRSWRINPRDPAQAPKLLSMLSAERADRGSLGELDKTFVMTRQSGNPVPVPVRSSEDYGYLVNATRDRLDVFDWLVGRPKPPQSRRHVFWSAALSNSVFEKLIGVLGTRPQLIVIARESLTEPLNYFLHDLGTQQDVRQLTRFAKSSSWAAQVRSEVILYKLDQRRRKSSLSAKLYLPPGYERGRDGPLPFVIWMRSAPYIPKYPHLVTKMERDGTRAWDLPPSQDCGPGREHLFLLAAGYGVLDAPTLPLEREWKQAFDEAYAGNLVAGIGAAVDAIVSLGVADRARIAVGGSDHGASVAMNALTSSSLFRAGIVLDGVYDYSLMPWGFEGEPRSYWEAPEIYSRISAFTQADKLDRPLLLLHTKMDDVPGRRGQPQRMYEAIKGRGGNARYVQLPLQVDGRCATESRQYVLQEMVQWLDRYVR